ncbi:hypothetical protein WJX82_008343 [Trebouxia sp. C0006]
MSSLWQTTTSAEWQAQLASVESKIQSLAKSGLLEVDRWCVQELPSVMQAREQLFLEKDEIVKLVEWKLTRGKWRPKLLDYAKHASEEEVVSTTKKAFACLGSAEAPALQEVGEALKELTSLKGVGPATASAMLTAVSASLPFMSDDAMAAALPGRPEYTVKKYLHLVTALRTKAEYLSNSSGESWSAAQGHGVMGILHPALEHWQYRQ